MKVEGLLSENTILECIGRKKSLFQRDLENYHKLIEEHIKNSSFLVLGGAGSIGSATVKQIFVRNPKLLHVVDISENNLAELVRDLRSSYGYTTGEFKTFCLDIGSDIFEKFFQAHKNYDYILNFTALKHVRSEKDPYTLMRMIEVNILNVIKTLDLAVNYNANKFFCVSTDKATNPVNVMGATKRLMEKILLLYKDCIEISSARFANVAFSDGSLLYSFVMRLQKKQPIVAPNDVKRYFITPNESGILCLISTILGSNMEIYFPKLQPLENMISFWDIAIKLLNLLGYEPYICETEEEARSKVIELSAKSKWPCLISKTDTSGEKEYEEFYSEKDNVILDKFEDIGIIWQDRIPENLKNVLNDFIKNIKTLRSKNYWSKTEIVKTINLVLPEFKHKETGKYLDDKL